MNDKTHANPDLRCPCDGGASYKTCCGALHEGSPAATAEALMRSRYSAYVMQKEDYLLASWAKATRPESIDMTELPRWIGLQVLRHVADGDRAEVEFVARYRAKGKVQLLHEISHFVVEDGGWRYVDGDIK